MGGALQDMLPFCSKFGCPGDKQWKHGVGLYVYIFISFIYRQGSKFFYWPCYKVPNKLQKQK